MNDKSATGTEASSGLIVTIDGPAGAGKSSVARRLARQLGADFLDTGAMYRGVAAAALAAGIDPADVQRTAEYAAQLKIRFRWNTDPPRLIVDGVDMTHRLRDADVTAAVSDVATNSAIRLVLVKAQQIIGQQHDRLVTEGRDQGSVVFPDATVKFYLDAAAEVRAKRRADELREAGQHVDEQKLLNQIIERDRRDSTRLDGPLICPDNAIQVDSSHMSLQQVVDHLAHHVRSIVPDAVGSS